MKWLEIIEMRSVDGDKDVLELHLEKLITEVEIEMHGKRFKSYRRVTVETDFSIHLFHETEQIEKCGSELGLRLAAALKEFGMVNHSIWMETHCKQDVLQRE